LLAVRSVKILFDYVEDHYLKRYEIDSRVNCGQWCTKGGPVDHAPLG